MEHPQLIRLERANHAVQQSSVVEQYEITFFPILRVD